MAEVMDIEAWRIPLFWAKVNKTQSCWLWTASKDGMGYGLFGIQPRRIKRAHIISWILHRGSVPNGMLVLHNCDTPSCIRPDHLHLGTIQDNMDERNAKSRHAHGETSGRAKLKAFDVLRIRQLRSEGMLLEEIASLYGVASETISGICIRRSWKHI